MKFKLKATARDWFIFGCFAVLLLYIVCIAVINLNSFATTGLFRGLNPFPAFGPNLIAATLLFYIAAIVFIFMSVSSYFFDKESGVGFAVGDKDTKDGYEKWADAKSFKKSLKEVYVQEPYYDVAGIPLINDGTKMWVDDGESHTLVIGSTGSGKTQCIIHPLVKILAKKGESMIVTDPKGEIYAESAGLLKENGYNIVVLNFRDPQKGNCWNPLSLPYNLYKFGNKDKSMELLDDLATNILYEEGGSKDPFWEKTAADYFAGLSLGLFEDANQEQININSINLMASLGDERYGQRSTYLKEYFNDKDPASPSYTCASGTVYAPEETKGSIVSTFKQKLRIFASRENLSEMLSSSDFDMADIGKHKTAVFMIIQDEKKTYHALATIFIKQVYETLIDVAQKTTSGELPIRTNFILDEFANMPPLKDVTTMITAARSRLIRFTMIIQNFAQLDAVYGKDNAQTIRSNCNNLIYLLTTELAALKEISELCGEKKVKVGKGDKEREETRPLVSVADLQKMKPNEVIIKRIRLSPFKTKLVPNYQMNWGLEKMAADPYVVREKKSIQVFNIKEFVENKRKDKFMDMFSGASTEPAGNPFMSNVNPLPNTITNTPTPSSNDIDVDDLVKKIDAKIAELEAEDKAEKEAKQAAVIVNNEMPPVAPNYNDPIKNEAINASLAVNNEGVTRPSVLSTSSTLTPTVDTNSDNVTAIYNSATPVKITDDQFFDDFFNE